MLAPVLQASDPLDLTSLGARYAAGACGRRKPSPASSSASRGAATTRSGSIACRRAELEARAAELERRGLGRPAALRHSRSRSRTTSTRPGIRPPRPARSSRMSPRRCAAVVDAAARRGRDPASARPTSTSSPPAWSACARPTACRATASTRSTCPAARAPARRSRWPRGWSASASAPTPPARAACRRHSTTSSGSSRRAACSARAAWCRPAARSIASPIFALTAADAAQVLQAARGFDARDPFSRPAAPPARAMPRSFAGCRVGVPREDQLKFFGNRETPGLFDSFIRNHQRLGAEEQRIDFAPVPRDRAPALRGALGRRALRRDPRVLRARARGAAPGDAHHHRRRHAPQRDRRFRRVLPAAGAAARDRGGLERRSTSC